MAEAAISSGIYLDICHVLNAVLKVLPEAERSDPGKSTSGLVAECSRDSKWYWFWNFAQDCGYDFGGFAAKRTKPMPIGGGKFIPPTGKKFSMQMVTIGRWKGGKMVEEYLFWDNAGFAKQIGLGN